MTNQASFLAIGLDTTVMLAASAGQLELNVMEPVITFALFMQMRVLTNACNALRTKCIDGITANAERTAQMRYELLRYRHPLEAAPRLQGLL